MALKILTRSGGTAPLDAGRGSRLSLARRLPRQRMLRSILVERISRALIAISERDPAVFEITECDGAVHVFGPHSRKSYTGLHWISPFSRDLYSGYFDPAAQPGQSADGCRDSAAAVQ
jgi:hypothetical protein